MALSDFRLRKIDPGECLGLRQKDSTMPGIVVGLLCIGAEIVHVILAVCLDFLQPPYFHRHSRLYMCRVFLGERHHKPVKQASLGIYEEAGVKQRRGFFSDSKRFTYPKVLVFSLAKVHQDLVNLYC